MRISVIIPAFNEERLIPGTLQAVQSALGIFSARGWGTELIVCDNNSTDHTADLARGAGATVVFEARNQIGRARNTGAAAATGEWLLFIDADSRPTPELFAAVADRMAGGLCLAGGSTVEMEGDSPAARRGARLWNWISRSLCWLAGSFIFCEASAFREVGGFSQELFASEEIDLSQKLKRLARQRGRRVVILDEHPLLTSARKLHLYTVREYLWFLLKLALWPRKTLRSREACHPWYDGRR